MVKLSKISSPITTSLVVFTAGIIATVITYSASLSTSKIQNSQSSQQKEIYWLLALGFLLSFISSIFLYFIFRSRSREYELQKELYIQSAKNDLVSLASHQLRTPATTVKQYISMILEGYAGDINEKQKEMLGKAFKSNERQLSIVNQILNLSQLESEKFTPIFEVIDLNSLVDEVIKECITNSPESKISFEPSQSAYAQVDVDLIRMVIDNLLSNAIKYSDNLPINVEVGAKDEKVFIKVSDSGYGIGEKDYENIFKLFHRIENERTLKISGTGVGLYLSKVIVDLHKGKIEVESQVGKGSIFTVTLPKNIAGDNK